MKERDLQRLCRRELRALDIRPPLRVDELCERLGDRRGRPIRLVPYSLPVPGPFGLWLGTDDRDLIVFQAETTRVHQDHIILHEVGHMLAEHGSDEDDEEFWRTAMPNLSPDMIRRALRRTCYDVDHEREAETVATIIMEWARVLDYTTPRTAATDDLHLIERALRHHNGWL